MYTVRNYVVLCNYVIYSILRCFCKQKDINDPSLLVPIHKKDIFSTVKSRHKMGAGWEKYIIVLSLLYQLIIQVFSGELKPKYVAVKEVVNCYLKSS